MTKADEISNDDNSLKKPSLCFVKTWLKQLANKLKKKRAILVSMSHTTSDREQNRIGNHRMM